MNMQSNRPEYASATCETHRNVGPRGVHGGVTLEFERSAEFSFVSEVTWPAGDNLDAAVENAVRKALAKIQSIYNYRCRLVAIKWHPVDSCQAGFAFVATRATHAALDSYQ